MLDVCMYVCVRVCVCVCVLPVCVHVCVCLCRLLLGNLNFEEPYLLAQVVITKVTRVGGPQQTTK